MEGFSVRIAIAFAFATMAALLSPTPAFAAGTIALPEPGTLTLLTLGIAGVLIGRLASRKPPGD